MKENNYIGLIGQDYWSEVERFSPVNCHFRMGSANSITSNEDEEKVKIIENDCTLEEIPHAFSVPFSNVDLFIDKNMADIIMSFNPQGVNIYPAEIHVSNGIDRSKCALRINNKFDVIDYEKSDWANSSFIPGRKSIISAILSNEKLNQIPKSERLIYKVEGLTQKIFDGSIIDALLEYEKNNELVDTVIIKLDICEEIPETLTNHE